MWPPSAHPLSRNNFSPAPLIPFSTASSLPLGGSYGLTLVPDSQAKRLASLPACQRPVGRANLGRWLYVRCLEMAFAMAWWMPPPPQQHVWDVNLPAFFIFQF